MDRFYLSRARHVYWAYWHTDYMKDWFIKISEHLFSDFKNKTEIIQKIKDMPLSAKTVNERAIEMAGNLTNQQNKDMNLAPAYSISWYERVAKGLCNFATESVGSKCCLFVACLEHVKTFLKSKDLNYPKLEDTEWLEKLHFVVDMTSHLNILNKSLQEQGNIALQMLDAVLSFQRKRTILTCISPLPERVQRRPSRSHTQRWLFTKSDRWYASCIWEQI